MGGQMQSGDQEQIEERERVERDEVRAGRAKPFPRCGGASLRAVHPCRWESEQARTGAALTWPPRGTKGSASIAAWWPARRTGTSGASSFGCRAVADNETGSPRLSRGGRLRGCLRTSHDVDRTGVLAVLAIVSFV